MKTTASTRRNGTSMQKYCVYTGVGTWLAANRQMAIREARGSRCRDRTYEIQAAKHGRARKRNCRVAPVVAPDRPNNIMAGSVFAVHQLTGSFIGKTWSRS